MTRSELWVLHPSPPRLVAALRTAACPGLTVEVSHLLGYPRIGLVAASGAFTLQYAPRHSRERSFLLLPLIAVGLAACMAVGCSLGFSAGGERWLARLVVAGVAFIASCLCEGLSVPPPGIASFVLVCAIGTNLPAARLASYTLGILIVGTAGAALALTDRVQGRRRDASRRSRADASARITHSWSGVAEQLKRWFTLHYVRSPVPLMAARASLAVLASGTDAVALGLPRPYWGMAAAAGIFALGSYTAVTMERAALRLAGTLIGVALAAALIQLNPDSWGLALSLGLLIFLSELFAIRNYAVAMVFVTPLALAITNAAGQGQLASNLLWTRSAETFIGCAFGLFAGLAVTRGWAGNQVRFALIEAARAMTDLLMAPGWDQQRCRRALTFRLERLERVALRTSKERATVRGSVAPLLPVVEDTKQLGHRILASSEEGSLSTGHDDLLRR